MTGMKFNIYIMLYNSKVYIFNILILIMVNRVDTYQVRVLSDAGLPTLYQVVKGFSIISTHKKRSLAEAKAKRLNK